MKTLVEREAVAPAIEWTPAPGALGAYRVGQSNPPHPADGMTAHVDLGGGAFSRILNPQSFNNGGLCWSLTWSDPKPLALVAASVISSYDYLLSGSITTKDAIARLRLLRAARRELATKDTSHG